MQADTDLKQVFRISSTQEKSLKRLGIESVRDLLYYFPKRYGDAQSFAPIADLRAGDTPIIYAEVKSIRARKAWHNKQNLTEATLEDTRGDTIKAIWFAQPYISKKLDIGSQARFMGVINERNGALAIINPEFERLKEIPIEQSGNLFADDAKALEQTLYPVYKETKGITSKWIYHHIQSLFAKGILDSIQDPIPQDILERYRLPSLAHALQYIHGPRKQGDADVARKRFAFEEMFFAQLVRMEERAKYEASGAFAISETSSEKIDSFTNSLPFVLTSGQKKATEAILSDMRSDTPMSRLLEGDVGSGKTIIAAIASFAAISSRPKDQSVGYLQVAYMAPTEILAKQIFEEFCSLFADFPVQIGLITGNECKKYPSKTSAQATTVSKSQLLKWVLNGEIQILIGTHALISKQVYFENLGLVIVDEQHRFGKKQRAALRNKGALKSADKKTADKKTMLGKMQNSKIQKKGVVNNDDILPHLLSMSATPIPRTLALTIYGDLDLTILDELPPGRQKIQTSLVRPGKREDAYETIRTELQAGRQAYVICPRIDEADPSRIGAIHAVAAESEAKRLQADVFPEYRVGVVHGKLHKNKKEEVMNAFRDHELDILVATSVIEVGVNVPNATSIIIEGAERFGLAQLHQLRGRVMRSSHKPYCYIFSDSQNEDSLKRLHALTTNSNGFALAEADLESRGSGELLGVKQSGMSDLAMESLKNLKLVEAARKEAMDIIQNASLESHQAMHQRFSAIQAQVYME
ncbi:MAG: ATP-dependent DNA helicase RecG [Patescibacteria group bacterium]